MPWVGRTESSHRSSLQKIWVLWEFWFKYIPVISHSDCQLANCLYFNVLSCPLMSSEFAESVTRGDPRLFLSASCWGALHSSRAAHGLGESAWDSDHDALRGGYGTGWAIRRHESMRRVATPEKKTYNSIVYVNGFVTRYGNPIPMVYHVFPIAVAVVGGMPFVIAVLYIYIIIYICVCACGCACVCVFGNAQVKSHARHKNPWGLADANCTKISRENRCVSLGL